MQAQTSEQAFEAAIEACLLEQSGYCKRAATDFDRDLCLGTGTLMAFIRATQPKPWGEAEARERAHGH